MKFLGIEINRRVKVQGVQVIATYWNIRIGRLEWDGWSAGISIISKGDFRISSELFALRCGLCRKWNLKGCGAEDCVWGCGLCPSCDASIKSIDWVKEVEEEEGAFAYEPLDLP